MDDSRASTVGAAPDPTRGSQWAEPFENGPGTFEGLPTLAAAELVEVSAGDFEPSEHVSIHLGEPQWVQSPMPPPGEGWVFVARLDSYYLFGSVFVFYKPETREAFHVLQYS